MHHRLLIDVVKVKSQLGISEVFLINDIAALAYAMTFSPEKQFEALQAGQLEKTKKIDLSAADTGLGLAFLLKLDAGEPVVFSSEGGHCDFASRTEEVIELMRFLINTNV